MGLYQTKKFCTAKQTMSKIKRQSMEQKRILQITNTTNAFQNIKKHLQFNSKKKYPQKTHFLNGQRTSVQFSHSVVSNSLRPHGLQHTRPPCPSPTSRVYSNSRPLSWWCHPTISASVIPFSSSLQFFPASESFPMSQFFVSGGQSIGVSASTSAFPMNIQDWFPLGWTGWISWQSKGLSKAFSNTTVQKHQFFGTQFSLWSNSHIHTRLLEKP